MEQIVLFALLLGLLAGWFLLNASIASWAINDAQKRGQSGGIIVPLIWLCGPFGAMLWLMIRPKTRISELQPSDYDNAEDAMAAASRLDLMGDWDDAAALYEYVAKRWPQHADYAMNSLSALREKSGL